MANRIKGITVEINGDTTKLSKALEGVNNRICFTVIHESSKTGSASYSPVSSTVAETTITPGKVSVDLGIALSASRLFTSVNVGSGTKPVYFKDGEPVACTYTLGKSVPSNADFSDTKVEQYSSENDADLRLLLSNSANIK